MANLPKDCGRTPESTAIMPPLQPPKSRRASHRAARGPLTDPKRPDIMITNPTSIFPVMTSAVISELRHHSPNARKQRAQFNWVMLQ
ncbi:hypothetical protein IMZ48_07560 [Candidatus Bathyarchaeota archaeon]|nr:hypothetical protein [Candidatus Bathyarchaeota archaeon]